LEVSAHSESIEASAHAKGDFFHDAVLDASDVDLREVYIDYTAGRFDFRLGRQIATWGVGDLLFINDVFPKDWVSFFSGRPLEYLKKGVDGFRTRYSSPAANAELFAIPFFTADDVPTPERFVLFDPFSSPSVRYEESPDGTVGDTELGLRLYRMLGQFDVSAHAYRGFWRTPSREPDTFPAPTRVAVFYPALSVFGMSAQGGALGGVLSLEAGYYHSEDDAEGDDAKIPNSQARFLAGHQQQVWADAVLGIQYYAEVMMDHAAYEGTLPAGFPDQGEYRDIATLRFEQLLLHQTWKLALMCFYSPTNHDFLLQPHVSYRFSDDLAATVGANVLGGEQGWTAFSQVDRNDHVYVSVRFDF
jgi:hypothetical protein